METLNAGDKAFMLKAMRTLGVKNLNMDKSDSGKKWPDIWCYPHERPPRIVVTREWARQSPDERRKRLTHELAGHIAFGWGHDELMNKAGFSTFPEQDFLSWRIYRDILNNRVRKPDYYIKWGMSREE